jgi:hypothetical protein
MASQPFGIFVQSTNKAIWMPSHMQTTVHFKMQLTAGALSSAYHHYLFSEM